MSTTTAACETDTEEVYECEQCEPCEGRCEYSDSDSGSDDENDTDYDDDLSDLDSIS
jgi:hypothetical protein